MQFAEDISRAQNLIKVGQASPVRSRSFP